MRIHLVAGFALMLMLLTAMPAHAAATGPAALNLVLSDLPAGFMLAGNINISMADAASESGESVAALMKQGRMGTNDVTFQAGAKLGNLTAIAGILTIDSRIVEFHTGTQASDEYQRTLTALIQQKQGLGLHPLALSAVGKASTAWTAKQTVGATKSVIDLVSFVRGRYVVNFNFVGLADKVNSKVLDGLTHIVDHRVQADGNY